MQCSACKEEMKEGDKNCKSCGASLERSEPCRSSQQVWWKYSVFSDKSIERLDQILFFVYIGFAFYIPISVVASLVIMHVFRKKKINPVYRKAGTVVIIGIAIFAMIARFVRTMPK